MPHAPLPPPSTEGSVVLEIGPGTGAVIIHATADHDGQEIDVSPHPAGHPRTHAAVRPRHLPDRTLYCAVITPLPAGDYTVWHDPVTVVTVPSGGIAEHRIA